MGYPNNRRSSLVEFFPTPRDFRTKSGKVYSVRVRSNSPWDLFAEAKPKNKPMFTFPIELPGKAMPLQEAFRVILSELEKYEKR